MNSTEIKQLKKMIDSAKVISFDMFDTLVFRRTNTPETVFDIVGKHFGIHGFRKLRMDEQNRASRMVNAKYGYPHADMNEIYEALAENKDIPVDWEEVKNYEIELEKDALVANKEMLEIFKYAKSRHKRTVVTSDMYLLADTLREILEKNGYKGFDYIYCSADEHKAKFNRELFSCVAEKEKVNFKNMLHIGDSKSADVEIPGSFGINTFLYTRDTGMENIKNVADADIDKGLYKILYNKDKGFWYNLGIDAGGPIYMSLVLWLEEKIKGTDKTVYFLSRDGYNLYQLFKKRGHKNIKYLYTSRRALLLAGITSMTDDIIKELPPFTTGQTIEEVLSYLCVPVEKIKHLKDVGFKSFNDRIYNIDDINAFKALYKLDEEAFLERCSEERKNAEAYFKETGFLDADSIVFDCGWSGSSQFLIDRFKEAVKCDFENYFYYFGIRNIPKSRTQLHKKHYETFAFDFYKNYSLQTCLNQEIVLFELFFSAPHESVFCYDENGKLIFENGSGSNKFKEDILSGICDYVEEGIDFAKKYEIEYPPELALGHIHRIIKSPTVIEATTIGNVDNVDGFVRQKGVVKKLAYITEKQFKINPSTEIYWMTGLLKRNDISDELKQKVAEIHGVRYPFPEEPEYHLEDQNSLNSYRRWINTTKVKAEHKKLKYNPFFSVVIPVYNTVTEQLKEAIDSVLAQVYSNFELILVDDHSSWQNVVPVLKSYETNNHVKVIYRTENGHISAATNDGIAISKGDFIAFMDCDDTIEPDALYEMAVKLNEDPKLDFIYSDEDKITEDGKIRHLPFFKPDWSPDLFMSMMYTNHLAIYRASIVKAIGGLRTAYNGCQDYDMTLRFMEHSDNRKVGHISKILYHWRERKESLAFSSSSKNYAAETTRYAKESALKRRGISGHMEYVTDMSQYRTVYDVTGDPSVSIIIPSKDNPKILKQCIDSIYEFTDYKNFEIIVVDNGSDTKNHAKIKKYLSGYGIKYLYGKYDFNFSLMCNRGAAVATGDYLLFLNDDVEMIQHDWMNRMLGTAQQTHIGAVGAKLYYPESTIIQHAGVGNIKEGPSHNFLRLDDSYVYYFGFNRLDYDCLAVTGACLMVSRKIFDKVGGFEIKLPVAYNDVDLCYKIKEAGYYNVQRNDVVAYHYESLSRGDDLMDEKKYFRLIGEREELYRRHEEFIQRDPFLNRNIHNYGPSLDLTTTYDSVERLTDLTGSDNVNGVIDACNIISDKVSITGWAFNNDFSEDNKTETFIIFKDPFGKLYRAGTCSTARPDVADAFNNPKISNCGYMSVIELSKIRADIIPYQLGIQIVDSKGNSSVKWTDKFTGTAHETRPVIAYNRWDRLAEFKPGTVNKPVSWCIDEILKEDKFVRIRGFAYCDNDNHYQYKKSVILKPEKGECLQFEVTQEERIDVATAFINVNFLYGTGLCCVILKNLLKSNTDYKLYIHMENVWDKNGSQDIDTGKTIRI